ncbi:MAG TPA: energy transducer TonB [Blastocatellia bacterium]|jgi:TonB family protein
MMLRQKIFHPCFVILILTAIITPGGRKAAPAAERPLRVALAGLIGDAARAFESPLKEALARDSRVLMIEPAQLQTALAGIGHDGSINMSKDEARRVGAAIGCDFFIVGKAEVFTRSEREKEEHEEAFVGVMIVDGRGGGLAAFDFVNERASTKQGACAAAIKSLGGRVAGYVERMNLFRAGRERAPESNGSELEKIEEMPDAEQAPTAGFKAPEFLTRVKPEYTKEASLANITATVEATAVFRADGEVSEIEITRWAGFGLDEAAERAIRQLKFKPATRDGQAVSVRAGVRYNFRRASSPGINQD